MRRSVAPCVKHSLFLCILLVIYIRYCIIELSGQPDRNFQICLYFDTRFRHLLSVA